jgi:hypothetical protein
LTLIKKVIGVGGIFAHGLYPRAILGGVVYQQKSPLSLKPKDPDFYIDKKYILYAIGLLADFDPEKALNIGINNLEMLNRGMG